ncbi:helix-turn-helix domain-containing protein [Mycoplasmatota bacterium]|nr:helix-turn-helix domain-containing protein [Mycoplasmatota bacterium]
MISNKEIGKRFKNIRENRGKTVEQFASIVGTNKSTWSRIENGQKKTLGYEEISIYCQKLIINIAEIHGTNYETFTNNQTKSIKALENNGNIKKDFIKYLSVLVVFSSIYAALYTTTYTVTSTIIIWIFFIISYIFSTIMKDESIVPTINYSITEYPFLINSLSEIDLKKKLRIFRYTNIYTTLIFSFVFVFLIGRLNELIQADEQMFLVSLFLWSIAWELAIVFDFNTSKFFTKSVFYEGSEKNFGFSKIRLSIINNGAVLFSYFMLETKYSDGQLYLKFITSILIFVLCLLNWFRCEVKYGVISKYSLSFNSNTSLK